MHAHYPTLMIAVNSFNKTIRGLIGNKKWGNKKGHLEFIKRNEKKIV